ncbi:hypothetical protein [Aquimarina sp. 2201CG5-10]|uniref:hypothetical protein n=1 Tax=Aquimarina callyspongiae TaxID=3098150 RepID=UPI002AB40DE2|nr:hypothetical protein [Aquimarina sp. 2201CG5-10]MDY8137972.1 hypothetical protein [Aquimarina sp. 2201CG5-10]
MSDNITFLNADWIWQIVVGALLLWILFIWKERYFVINKKRFWIHISIAFLAITSLIMIALKPAIIMNSEVSKIALLTKDYNEHQLDSLKKIHKRLKTKIYRANQSVFEKNNSDSILLLGIGIEPYDFWQLDNYNVSYLSSDVSSGVIKFKYDQQNIVGQELVCQGLYKKPLNGNTLILQDPGGVVLDSIPLSGEDEQLFTLRTKLKVKGKYVYTLAEKNTEGKIVSQDPIPIVVEESNKLTIVIINSFPTFETKYLKNFLTSMGHKIVVRSQITKGKYKFEYLNTPRIPLGTLNEKSLEPFDLLVVDGVSLKNMSKRSRENLENAVRRQGLGVFIQSDVDYFRFSVKPAAFNFIKDKKVNINVPDLPVTNIPKYNFLFKAELGLQPVHVSDNKEIVSAYKHIGAGRIGTTALKNTYELLLSGNVTAYQKLWSELISDISNKETPKVAWQSVPGVLYKDEPLDFVLRTSISKPKVTTDIGYQVSLLGDVNISNLWKGTTYPKKYGWNMLTTTKDSINRLEYFVTDTTRWRSLVDYNKIAKNLYNFNRTQKNTKPTFIQEPINPLIFFSIFLICIGYLWLAPKISNRQ